MKQPDVEMRIIKAKEKLLKKDRFLLRNDVNERSITHKLAQYLEKQFPGWDVDCEYNRVGKTPMNKKLRLQAEPSCTNDTDAKTVYPDIIVHHRGKEKQNLLVIEAKKKSNRSGPGRDENKLRSFADELGYQHCVLVIFDVDRVCHRFTKPARRAD